MDNNCFDLQGGGPIIDPDFNGKRCALRNLFGLAFSPVGTEEHPFLARRAALISSFRLMSQSLAD